MIVIPVHRTNKEPDLNKEFELTSKRDDECERMKVCLHILKQLRVSWNCLGSCRVEVTNIHNILPEHYHKKCI